MPNFTQIIYLYHKWALSMMTSSNGNIFRVTGPLCGEFTGHWWIPRTKASDTELWCFFWSAPEQKVDNREICDLRHHRAHYDVTIMNTVVVYTLQYSLFLLEVPSWLLDCAIILAQMDSQDWFKYHYTHHCILTVLFQSQILFRFLHWFFIWCQSGHLSTQWMYVEHWFWTLC